MSTPVPFPTECVMMAAGFADAGVRDWALYSLAVLGIGLGALIWVGFIRRAKKHRRRHHRTPGWEHSASQRHGAHRSGRSRRRRHSQSARAPMNPTLAETGGLPPVRSEDPVDPPDGPR